MPAKKYKYAYRKTITLADGKRHDICANTKEEFEEKLLEVQLLAKQGIVPTNMTVAEFAKIWFKTYKDSANLRLNSKASIKNKVYLHRNKQVLADDAAQAAREAFGSTL